MSNYVNRGCGEHISVKLAQKWDFEARHVPSRVFIGSVYAQFGIRAGVDVHCPRGYGRLTVADIKDTHVLS